MHCETKFAFSLRRLGQLRGAQATPGRSQALAVTRTLTLARCGLGLLLSLMSSACGPWRSISGPDSILLIAVEQLGTQDLECRLDSMENESRESAIARLCGEAVQFTRAYTTSVLSGPALASILTGMPPRRTGYRHHGRGPEGSLSPRVPTVSERALERGWSTALISGGAPILRRTGLNQGFEVFDDSIELQPWRSLRSADVIVERALGWLKEWSQESRSWRSASSFGLGRRRPFFLSLYFHDPAAPWHQSYDQAGRARAKTREEQIHLMSEQLSRLFRWMDDQEIWHQTRVILVGLQGPLLEVDGQLPRDDVFGRSAQVAMLIKPPERELQSLQARSRLQPGRPAHAWVPQSVLEPSPISTMDLGATLVEWIEGQADLKLLADDARSLLPILQAALAAKERTPPLPAIDRPIATESAWRSWWLRSARPEQDVNFGPRLAIRRGYHLYVHDVRPKLFDTRTDVLEGQPIPRNSTEYRRVFQEMSELAERWGYVPAPEVTRDELVVEALIRWSARWRIEQFFPDSVSSRTAEALQRARVSQDEWDELRQSWPQFQYLLEWSGWRGFVGPMFCLEQFRRRSLAEGICPEIFKWALQWLGGLDQDEREAALQQIQILEGERRLGLRVADVSLAQAAPLSWGRLRQGHLGEIDALWREPELASLRAQLERRWLRSAQTANIK
jgi:hypothetical protein